MRRGKRSLSAVFAGIFILVIIFIGEILGMPGRIMAASTLTILHDFLGGASDEANSRGCLTLSGSALYGTTCREVVRGYDSILRDITNWTGYRIPHEFASGPSDGAFPSYFHTLPASTLYETSAGRDPYGYGTIFRIQMTYGDRCGLLFKYLW